jgi:hypothetical protein
MGTILDFALLGLLFLFIMAAIYSIVSFILISIYSYFKYSDFSMGAKNYYKIIQASVISASLNNLTISVISAIAISELIARGFSAISGGIAAPSLPFGNLLYLFVSIEKILNLSIISIVFWQIIAFIIAAYSIGKNGKRGIPISQATKQIRGRKSNRSNRRQ